MTPAEGETAVTGLVVLAGVPWALLGALFVARIWRVSTAAKPKRAEQAPDAAAAPEPVAEPKPLREAS